MACTVKIVQVIGQTKSGVLVSVKAYGSASSNCGQVTVTITCDGQSRQFTSWVTDGAWSVVVPPGDPREHPCQCGSPITVVAECETKECHDKFSGTLDCEEIKNCPDAITSIDKIDPDSKCGPGGTRTVTGSVTVSPDPSLAVGATVSIDGVPGPSHPATTTPYTLPFSASLTPGTHTVKVSFTDGCGSSGTTFTVPPCPGTEACPKVELQDVKEGDCRDGKRAATVTVKITPTGGAIDAQLTHGGKTLDSAVAQVAVFTLTGNDTFSSSDAVTVNVSKPPGCPPTSLAINVQPCPTGQQPSGGPPGDSGGDDDGDGSGGCLIGRYAVELLLAAALFLTLVGLCVPGAGTAFLIAAGAAAAAAAIAFGLWWLLCGSKCGALLMVWQVSMIGAWVCAFLATCCVAALALAIGLGAAAAALFATWISKCKPSKCKTYSELLWVYVAALGTIFAYLGKVVPCGLPAIPLIAAAIAAALTVAVGLTCGKK